MSMFRDAVAAMDKAIVRDLGDQNTTYITERGEEIQVPGIFDARHQLVDAGEAGVSSTAPAVFYRLQDLPVDPSDEEPTVIVDGATYKTVDVKKDGLGGVWIVLQKR